MWSGDMWQGSVREGDDGIGAVLLLSQEGTGEGSLALSSQASAACVSWVWA